MAGRRTRWAVAVAAAGVGLAVVAGAPSVARPAAADLLVPPALAPVVVPASVTHVGGGTAVLDLADLAREVAPVVAAPAVAVAWPLPDAAPAVVANPRTAWGPPVAVMASARAVVEAMPLEVLAGQVMVARYTGPDPAVPAALVAGWHLAGVILMGENVVSLDQVRSTTAAVHAAAQADGRTWPAVVAVDEEGGRVSRLRGLLADLPAFATFGASGDDAATHARFTQLGSDLASLGFTMDLAPVADVTIGPADPTIGDRSASLDPTVAGRTVVAAATGLLDGGTVPVVKHFPGHGSVTTDSHAALPLQPATTAELAVRDLVPFRVATASGAPVVMIGHLDVPALEPGVPASLSAATYRLLRADLGFEGVAVTDALDMGAVPASGDEAVRALVAGADLVLMPRDVATAHAAIVAAVQDGRLPQARLQEAATRVVALQMWTALLP